MPTLTMQAISNRRTDHIYEKAHTLSYSIPETMYIFEGGGCNKMLHDHSGFPSTVTPK